MPRADLERLQAGRLQQRFGVGSRADLESRPFATKSMLRDAYPFGLLRVPLSDCVRVHASSGTRGKPTIVAYTRGDIAALGRLLRPVGGRGRRRPGDDRRLAARARRSVDADAVRGEEPKWIGVAKHRLRRERPRLEVGAVDDAEALLQPPGLEPFEVGAGHRLELRLEDSDQTLVELMVRAREPARARETSTPDGVARS